MTHRAHNFSAGPAALPLPALELAQKELLNFAGTGASVMELSHRGKEYEAIHDEATALLRELLSVPDTHDILFLQGGASQQFAQIPMNFLPQGGSADYVVTGAWGEKAVEEAKIFGNPRIAASTLSGSSYTRVPNADEIQISETASYVHYTTNETIHGVQFHHDIDAKGRPLVCDMSSDFLWKPFDVSRYSFIYAGAQKNVGPSGVVLIVISKEFAAQGAKNIPKIFKYSTHISNKSLYNTAPTFAIYLARNVLRWVKDQGGLSGIEAINRRKSDYLYNALDSAGGFYRLPVEKSARSTMNVVWRLPTEALEDQFVKEAKAKQMIGLKGHRSVGGIRASIYNAVSEDSVKLLADFATEFAKKNG